MSFKLAARQAIRVGVLTPQSGPIGLFGPSSVNCARLAAEEINALGGLFDRPIELVFGDGGGTPEGIVAEARRMIDEDRIQALVGSHVSPNREALVRAIGGRLPYIYTTLYEGGEYSFGVFVCGETPAQQLQPLVEWLCRHRAATNWYIVGNDYTFPRKSVQAAKAYIAAVGGAVVGEEYAPLFTEDFYPSLDRIRRSKADAVLIYLVGSDSILFNRQFAVLGLEATILRAAPVLCENTLLGIGADATSNLYSAAGFTNCLETRQGVQFRDSYRRRFGTTAPVPNRYGVACYEGVQLLAALAARAGRLDVYKMQAFADGVCLTTPRGECRMSANHLGATAYVAEAAGTDLAPIDSLGYRSAAPAPAAIWSPVDAGNA